MTITEHFAKVEKEFKKKIGYKEIRKCCINCMFCHGYEEEPTCLKLAEAGVKCHVKANSVCKLWTERFGIPKEWGLE